LAVAGAAEFKNKQAEACSTSGWNFGVGNC
jgi:hypothetical protein